MLPDVERVTRLLVEVGAEEVLPRFQSLADHEINYKAGGEVVTVVDEAVELSKEQWQAVMTRNGRDPLSGTPRVRSNNSQNDGE